MSTPDFQIIVARTSDAHTVYLSGSVDLAASLMLTPKLEEITEECTNELRLDLGHVTFMDSEGLKALITAYKRMQAKSAQTRVVRSSKCVTRILQLTGMDQLLQVDTERLAIA